MNSSFQTTLKYKGTFLNLYKYSDDIEKLIKSGGESLHQEYTRYQQKINEKQIKNIAEHISLRDNIHFSDNEFEEFVGHLFEISYEGFTAFGNSKRKEAEDGKDLIVRYSVAELDIDIELNIQVKQHEGYTDEWAIEQISKSDNSEQFTKNIVVTSASQFSKEAIKKAKRKNVLLIKAIDLAKMIVDNFDKMKDEYKTKLGLYPHILPRNKT